MNFQVIFLFPSYFGCFSVFLLTPLELTKESSVVRWISPLVLPPTNPQTSEGPQVDASRGASLRYMAYTR